MGSVFAFVAAMLAKGVVVLTAATLAMRPLKRASAGLRHLVLQFALVGLLLLPILSVALPSWALARQEAPIAFAHGIPAIVARHPPRSAITPAVPSGHPAALREFPWTTVALAVWLVGLLANLLKLSLDHRAARRLLRSAHHVTDPSLLALKAAVANRLGVAGHRARLLVHDRLSTPIAFANVILLPSAVADAPTSTRAVALTHELAHVARRDSLGILLGRIAVALHWPNPLAWLAFARLRTESELATDDRVLTTGIQPSLYASELVAMARQTRHQFAPSLVISMASAAGFEERVRAILDVTRHRVAPRLSAVAVACVVALALFTPLACVTPTAAPQRTQLLAPVQMPHAQSLLVSRDGIYDGATSVPIVALQDGVIAPAALRNGAGSYEISALAHWLAAVARAKPFDRGIVLRLDREVPSLLLTQVLYTAGQQGFDDWSLSLDATGRYMTIKAPRFEADGRTQGLNLTVNIGPSGFTVAAWGAVLPNEQTHTTPTLPALAAGLPWAQLSHFLQDTKATYPNEHTVILTASPEIRYTEIVHAIDILRAGTRGEELFPDVLFSIGVL
jgi:beta-lactamase regulating signal transducer with metallopeptidase domain